MCAIDVRFAHMCGKMGRIDKRFTICVCEVRGNRYMCFVICEQEMDETNTFPY